MPGLTLLGDTNPVTSNTSATANPVTDTAEGDFAVLCVVSKPAATTVATPTGWSSAGSQQVGTGAVGPDSGPLRITLFHRVVPSGGLTIPALAISGTGAVISVGLLVWRPDPGWTVTVSTTQGSDTTADTTWSVTGAGTLGYTADDHLLALSAATSNVPTFTAEALTVTGATFTALDSRWDAGTGIGDNLRSIAHTAECTAGTATAAPAHTMTASAAVTGGAMFLRLHPVPPPPGFVLDIGSGDGQNHFNIGIGHTVPFEHVDTSQALIAGGFTDPPWWQTVNVSGVDWVRHRVQLDAEVTSINTDFPRCELREFEQNGTTETAFDPTTGEHRMRGRSRITHLPPVNPSVVICQIHSGSNDAARISTQLESGQTNMRCRINGTAVGTPKLAEPYVIDTEFDWMMELIGGDLRIYYGDLAVPVVLRRSAFAGAGATYYFKAGAYAQSNETIDSGTDHVEVLLRQLQTWHSGAAAPNVPVGLPTVGAGADASATVGSPFTRAATESGPAVNTRRWVILDGPAGIGDTIGTGAALTWLPPRSGTYRLRYAATADGGQNFDDCVVTVAANPAGEHKFLLGM
ncbi:MAG: polysaccharide lyase family 7 protein [Actinomycetota bacterium]|nr:polysaccharide lyase family 7 protein [Actinomycetota bacterium]